MRATHRSLPMTLCLLAAGVGAITACGARSERGFRPEHVSADDAIVYVYRPPARLSLRGAEVYVDQEHAGTLAQGEYLALHVTPGERIVRVEARTSAARRIDARPGEAVYLELVVRRMGRRVVLEESDRDVALDRIARTSRAQP